ncbi:annexin B9-like [Copidosoma floridanum]|uniref:annexin B9-like n=1 Tax=Copidosoma floridanum TaxID=29053 RepID=UPI0006C99264|nr:annexin B9-like [Copidosoma floridanum]
MTYPTESFNASAAALKFGKSPYLQAVSEILTVRQLNRRLEIAEAYKILYGRDLVDDLTKKLFHQLKDVYEAYMTPLADYFAKGLHHAMDGLGTDEVTLMEILFTLSNEVIKSTAASYEKLYNRSLESDVIDDTSGGFKSLLCMTINGSRNENQIISSYWATHYALDLFMDDESIKTSEDRFTTILGTCSFKELKQIFIEYNEISGHSIEKAIKSKHFSRDLEMGLLQIVQIAKSKTGYFAKRLHDSFGFLYNNDCTLIRIIVTRREIDLQDIKKQFKEHYGKELRTMIATLLFDFFKYLNIMNRSLTFSP